MKNKKGFTLIELLAVIVILAVIALVATPLIMNVINDAKENAFKDSGYGILKAVEMKVATEQINRTDGQNIGYKVDVRGDGIDYNGDRPESGWASVDVNGVVSLYMVKGDWCAYKDSTTNGNVEITTTLSTCTSNITTISEDETLATLTANGSEGGNSGSTERAVYSFSSSQIYAGDLLSSISDYTEDYRTLNKTFFLKHIIDTIDSEDTVVRNDLCFLKNNTLYCLKNREDSVNGSFATNPYYEENRSTLLRAFGPNAMENGICQEEEGYASSYHITCTVDNVRYNATSDTEGADTSIIDDENDISCSLREVDAAASCFED